MLGQVHIIAAHPMKCGMPSTAFSQLELTLIALG